MQFKIAIAICALVGVSQTAIAQDRTASTGATQLQLQTRTWSDLSDRPAFEAGVANLTVNAAFTPTALSQQQALSLWLLMSMPRNGAVAKNSMKEVTQ